MRFKQALIAIVLMLCLSLSAKQAPKLQGIEELNRVGIVQNDVNFFRYLSKDKVNIVEAFLDAGYGVNSPNQASQSPLIVAAQKGAYKSCKLLIQKGADVDATDCDGSTPLMYAANERQVKIAKLLISNKADVNKQNKNGWTALMFAINIGKRDIIDALITIDTDPMLRNKDNKTVRDFAKEHRFDKLPQYIADKIAYLQDQKMPKHKSKKPKDF